MEVVIEILRKMLYYSDSKKLSIFFRSIFFENEKYVSENENFGKDRKFWKFSSIKKFYKHLFKKNRSKKKLRKIESLYRCKIFRGTILRIIGIFSIEKIFLEKMLLMKKINIFEILTKNVHFQKDFFEIFFVWKKFDNFSNHYIDVKFPGESIFRILGAIWYRLIALSAIWKLFHYFDSHILGPADILDA